MSVRDVAMCVQSLCVLHFTLLAGEAGETMTKEKNFHARLYV